VLSGENPYGPASHGRANWGPVWPWMCGLMLAASRLTSLPFHFLVKPPPSLADAGIALLLWRMLGLRGHSPRTAFMVALGYALNPVAILVSGAHGQFDAIPLLLALGALAAFPSVWASAVLLGLGIATKTWVVLLLPFFIQRPGDLRSRLLCGALAVLPLIILLLPYYLDSPATVREHVLAYSGGVDQGWAAVVRVILNLVHGTRRLGEMVPPGWMLLVGKVLVLAGLAAMLVAARRRALDAAAEGVLLAFYIASAGVATQYFLWILPFAHLRRERWLVVYTLAAVAAALGFYLVFYPEVLFGFRSGSFAQAVLHSSARPAFAAAWILATGCWWLVCVAALAALLRAQTRPAA